MTKSDIQIQQISLQDFFRKNRQFSIWLIKKKKKHYEQISYKKALKYFNKFVSQWNSKKLNPLFYKVRRKNHQLELMLKYHHLLYSTYKWNFKLSIDDVYRIKQTVENIRQFNLQKQQVEEQQQQIELREKQQENIVKPKVYGTRPQQKSATQIIIDMQNQSRYKKMEEKQIKQKIRQEFQEFAVPKDPQQFKKTKYWQQYQKINQTCRNVYRIKFYQLQGHKASKKLQKQYLKMKELELKAKKLEEQHRKKTDYFIRTRFIQ